MSCNDDFPKGSRLIMEPLWCFTLKKVKNIAGTYLLPPYRNDQMREKMQGTAAQIILHSVSYSFSFTCPVEFNPASKTISCIYLRSLPAIDSCFMCPFSCTL